MPTAEAILDYFAKLVFSELGIVYSDVNRYQLDTRLQDCARQLGLDGPEGLYEAARRGLTPAMKLLLLDLATNNETLFFRDPGVFAAIEQVVLGTPRTTPFKVWSAACSTGQEVYSLAMLFERLGPRLPHGYEILATDVSERALKQASEGRYGQLHVQRGLNAAQLVQCFDQVVAGEAASEWTVKPHLKRHLTFKKANLLEPFTSLGRFDLILCRNVLIYQEHARKKDIVARLHERLEPGGFLVLGAAETLIAINDDFEMVRTEKAVIYRKTAAARKAG